MQQLLTESEAVEVLSILKGSVDKNFESVTLSFGLLFRHETDKFRACCGLVYALLDDGFLDSKQRLLALFALLELYRDRPPDSNPFWEFLFATATSQRTPPEEAELIHLFLERKRGTELLRRNVDEYLSTVHTMPPTVILSHIEEMQRLYRKHPVKDKGIGALAKSGLHRIVIEKSDNDAIGSIPRIHQEEIFQSLAKDMTTSGFEPIHIRPSPPIAPLFASEVQWRYPPLQPALMWDCEKIDPPDEALQRLKALLDEAILKSLTSPQQKQAVQDLKEDSSLAFRCHMDPDTMPALVEHAPLIASELLICLLTLSTGPTFLSALMTTSISLQSMEVVNHLLTSVTLPPDFVQEYISHCLSSCNAIEDRYVQSRFVRLVCVFLQNLIRHGFVDIISLTHEIQAFCIDHSRIREAAGLFRLLKQMDHEAEGSS